MPVLDVGLYGKFPSHGDFLRRRVSDAFVAAWDDWLQACLQASGWALGERWLDVYLTSPAWRFACAAGTCGPSPVVGLMVPSVDRVGRYFPLTLVAEVPHTASLVAVAGEAGPLFDSAERLVVETLAAEQIDFEGFDDRLVQLGHTLGCGAGAPRLVLESGAAAVLADDAQASWQIPLGPSSQLAPAFEQLLWQRLSSLHEPLVLWWTEGSSIVEPSCLVGKGLPHPDTFAALLDGSWAARRWQSIAAHVETPAAVADTLIEAATPLRFRSTAATDAGRVRDINQDAWLERPEVGVWAVADGLGGHSNGEIASRMVCDALADVVPGSSFDEAIEHARLRMHQVNEHLLRAATRARNTAGSASTVVALLTRGTRCAILWAGDSRVYRWRTGRLEQLTRDHSLAGADGSTGEECHAVTRAVGCEPVLTLDLHVDRVRAGDRFLLCSDGLTRVVPEARIRTWMEHDDVHGAVLGLIKATLDAGAPDNVTVLIVEAVAQ